MAWLKVRFDFCEFHTLILRVNQSIFSWIFVTGITLSVFVKLIKAYLFSSMSEDELKSHNWTLKLFSVIYLGLTAIFGNIFGCAGITIAQLVNMSLRILHGIRFISMKHQEAFGTFFIQSLPQEIVRKKIPVTSECRCWLLFALLDSSTAVHVPTYIWNFTYVTIR